MKGSKIKGERMDSTSLNAQTGRAKDRGSIPLSSIELSNIGKSLKNDGILRLSRGKYEACVVSDVEM